MSIALINPNLVVQRNDPLTTGIVYMPLALAYVAGAFKKNHIPFKVIDAFGQKPFQARKEGKFLVLGLTCEEICQELAGETRIVFIYAINLTNHLSTIKIIQAIKAAKPSVKVVVLENTQAVTAYSLKIVAQEFYQSGADYILTGESDHRAVELARILLEGQEHKLEAVEGLGGPDFYRPPASVIADLDTLDFPPWELFPLENYWSLRFAHGPVSSKRYLPILTSRGCPYPCRFCVVPATNNQRWRARSAKNVVDEMERRVNALGVNEFHIEDLDPTISDERIREICHEIIRRNLEIIWKIAAGTKVETIRNEETVELMARAGCRYISVSPETGSPRLLKLMRKPFDLKHALRLVKEMNRVRIRSQACFVLGFPTENDEDRELTWQMVHDLTKNGIDEIALFIVTPVPGSAIFEEFSGYSHLSELNFTPAWRQDYKELNRFRLRLYRDFLMWKLWYHPLKMIVQPMNFLRRHFETKMEMVPYRALVLKWLEVMA